LIEEYLKTYIPSILQRIDLEKLSNVVLSSTPAFGIANFNKQALVKYVLGIDEVWNNLYSKKHTIVLINERHHLLLGLGKLEYEILVIGSHDPEETKTLYGEFIIEG
jgi:hypothetical protein